ncbi:MAG: CesT family type III secretion system chaperone [Rhabdochlamydiaceae bacterium]
MIDRFEQLLNELGTQYTTPLHPDKKGACKLMMDENSHIQLECDAHQENLLVAAFICDLPPGKYRENILKDALKANAPSLKNGILAYSDRNNQLVLFSYLPMLSLNGKKLAEFLTIFLDKVKNWRIGVETGHTSHLVKFEKTYG